MELQTCEKVCSIFSTHDSTSFKFLAVTRSSSSLRNKAWCHRMLLLGLINCYSLLQKCKEELNQQVLSDP